MPDRSAGEPSGDVSRESEGGGGSSTRERGSDSRLDRHIGPAGVGRGVLHGGRRPNRPAFGGGGVVRIYHRERPDAAEFSESASPTGARQQQRPRGTLPDDPRGGGNFGNVS